MAFNVTYYFGVIDKLSSEDRKQILSRFDITDIEQLREEIASGLSSNVQVHSNFTLYSEYRLSKILLLYIPPILIVLGTFGNVFSFVILRQRSMARVSTYFYLAILAIADSMVLCVGLLRLWVEQLLSYDIKNKANWICKLIVALAYFSSNLSVWLIIAVTVERYIVVCYPLKASSVCNLARAKKVVLVLVLVLVAINSHFFWTVELVYRQFNGKKMLTCDRSRMHLQLVKNVWPWIETVLYSLIPFLIITILNGIIISRVVKARKFRRHLQKLTSNFEECKRVQSESSLKLTVMLLAVSFVFLVTVLPMNFQMIVRAFLEQRWSRDQHEHARVRLSDTVTKLLMYTNHSINFVLYCAVGQKFRYHMVRAVCPWNYRKRLCLSEKKSAKAKEVINLVQLQKKDSMRESTAAHSSRS